MSERLMTDNVIAYMLWPICYGQYVMANNLWVVDEESLLLLINNL